VQGGLAHQPPPHGRDHSSASAASRSARVRTQRWPSRSALARRLCRRNVGPSPAKLVAAMWLRLLRAVERSPVFSRPSSSSG
jgi:hypothetical protein